MSTRMVDRFVQRLHLPQGASCRITRTWSLVAAPPQRPPSPATMSVLELYHSPRSKWDVEGVLAKGFKLGFGGNKGPGVYLANHSRYAWRWGGPSVFVCHVPTTARLRRFRSEVASGNPACASEYVVDDPRDVQPVAVIEFQVQSYTERDVGGVYVDGGDFGCPVCDPRRDRCDCEQLPSVAPLDQITVTPVMRD